MSRPAIRNTEGPLADLDDWESAHKQESDHGDSDTVAGRKFRDYRESVRPGVAEFYRLNHTHQTFDFVLAKKREFLSRQHATMTIWQAMEFLNTLVDDSDPDTDLSQIEHLMQTAEEIRKDGHPRWFVLTGLIHDLGKILCLFGEPQWAVVGDTFPVGCRYSDKIVFHEYFDQNPDLKNSKYQTVNGIYEPGCGLDSIHLSWGHDEYLYHIVKDGLPAEGLAMIRYHSCYPVHRAGEYSHLLNERDRELMDWVRKFNPYDLYSKGQSRPDVAALTPYYEDLINEFFPKPLAW